MQAAVASGLRKHYNTEDTTEFAVTLDRMTGDISVARNGEVVPLSVVGRIGAQTVKQVMIQLIRADERGAIYEEYKERVGTIITGTIARFEGGTMIVNLGKTEGIMPRLVSQIRREIHRINQTGVSILLVEQNVETALRLCPRVFLMEKGTVVYSGAAQELKAEPEIVHRYLGLSKH